MSFPNIPKNQVKSRNTIEQREHEDNAAARRVVPTDQDGEFFGTPTNPIYTSTGASVADQPDIYNIEADVANQEYSQLLPDHTGSILIRVRDGRAKLQLSFNSGETGTKFITVEYGNNFFVSGVDLIGKSIYFQVNKPDQVVEILTWS